MNIVGVLVNNVSSSLKWTSAQLVIMLSQAMVYLSLLNHNKFSSTQQHYLPTGSLWDLQGS